MIEFIIGWVIGLLTLPLGKYAIPWFLDLIEKKINEIKERKKDVEL